RRDVRVRLQPETDRDLASFRTAVGRDDFDARDAGDRRFQNLRNLTFDDLRAGAGIFGGDVDDGLVDVGIFANRERAVRYDAAKQDDQAHHRREDGPLDEKFEDIHSVGPAVDALLGVDPTTWIEEPSRRR